MVLLKIGVFADKLFPRMLTTCSALESVDQSRCHEFIAQDIAPFLEAFV